MSEEELISKLVTIFGNGCLSDDKHVCKFDGNCQEHEKVKAKEILEIYTKQIRADEYNQALEDFEVSLEKHQQENWIDNLEYGITFTDVESVIDELKK